MRRLALRSALSDRAANGMIKVVETFDPDASQTLAEHAASHNFPMHVRQCGACRFWQHKEKWSASCSATNPVTRKKETWLGHAGGGYIVCLICAARPRANSEIARGRGSCSRLANLVRRQLRAADSSASLAS